MIEQLADAVDRYGRQATTFMGTLTLLISSAVQLGIVEAQGPGLMPAWVNFLIGVGTLLGVAAMTAYDYRQSEVADEWRLNHE